MNAISWCMDKQTALSTTITVLARTRLSLMSLKDAGPRAAASETFFVRGLRKLHVSRQLMFVGSKNTTATVCERPVRDKTYVLLYASTICGSLALLGVLMRIFVAVRQNSFGYDDLCACLASAMAVPNFIGLAISAKQGLGKDIWTLTPEEIQKCLRVSCLRDNAQHQLSRLTIQ